MDLQNYPSWKPRRALEGKVYKPYLLSNWMKFSKEGLHFEDKGDMINDRT